MSDISDFQERLRETYPSNELITTERSIIIDDPKLDTDVPTLWETPPSKPQNKNPLPFDRIGMYTKWYGRRCVTADMEYIQTYYEIFHKSPPGFFQAGPREYLYFNPKAVKVAIVTAGGIAPGLNMVIHSLVCRQQLYGTHNENIYGFRNGFRGLEDGDYIELSSTITHPSIHRGGTILGTRREDEKADVDAIVNTLEALHIDILYIIGGNGSLSAANAIWKEITRRKLLIAVVGIPKTMDNDLLWVWKSFGFDTAVAEATRTIEILHEEAESNNRICILKLFGRDSGFVAANATLASGEVDAVLIPEENPIDINRIIDHLIKERNVIRKRHAMIVVAEGVKAETVSNLIIEIKKRFGGKSTRHSLGVFENEPGHLIRAVPAGSSEQIYCRRLADLAVDNSLAGFTNFMISCWLTEYVLVPIPLAVAESKRLPTGSFFWKEVLNSTGQPSLRQVG